MIEFIISVLVMFATGSFLWGLVACLFLIFIDDLFKKK